MSNFTKVLDCDKKFSEICDTYEKSPGFILNRSSPDTEVTPTLWWEPFCYVWGFVSHFILEGMEVIFDYHESNILFVCSELRKGGDALIPFVELLEEIVKKRPGRDFSEQDERTAFLDDYAARNPLVRDFLSENLLGWEFFDENLRTLIPDTCECVRLHACDSNLDEAQEDEDVLLSDLWDRGIPYIIDEHIEDKIEDLNKLNPISYDIRLMSLETGLKSRKKINKGNPKEVEEKIRKLLLEAGDSVMLSITAIQS